MNKENFALMLKHILKFIIIGIIASAITIIICKICGVKESLTYSNILTYIGVGFFLIGISGIIGSHKSLGYYDFSHEAKKDRFKGKSKSNLEMAKKSYFVFINNTIIAVIFFICAILIWDFKITF